MLGRLRQRETGGSLRGGIDPALLQQPQQSLHSFASARTQPHADGFIAHPDAPHTRARVVLIIASLGPGSGMGFSMNPTLPVPCITNACIMVAIPSSFLAELLSDSFTASLARQNIGSANSFICCSLHWGLQNAPVPVDVECLASKWLQPTKINNRPTNNVYIFIVHLCSGRLLDPRGSMEFATIGSGFVA
jgi:hypothetical protein